MTQSIYNPRWCDKHGNMIAATWGTDNPVNELVTAAWLLLGAVRWLEGFFGASMVVESDADMEGLDALVMAMCSPICCKVSDGLFVEIMSRSILPNEFRDMEPQQARQKHLEWVLSRDPEEGK